MISEDVVRVHVENADDLRVQKTEEHEPEHFAFTTRVIGNAAGYDLYTQLLAEDPRRKDFSILTVDAPIVLCHSAAQANAASNIVATTAQPPQGAYIPAGTSFTFTGTGAVWIAATSATPTRVSVAANRRGSALWGSRVAVAVASRCKPQRGLLVSRCRTLRLRFFRGPHPMTVTCTDSRFSLTWTLP